MRRLVRRLVEIGISEDLDEPEARRIRTLNVGTLAATVLSILTTTFYVVWVNPDSALSGWVITVLFVAGYVCALVVNSSGRVELAVWLALSTGCVQIVITTFIVGFEQGPAPLFLVIAVAAVLLTRIDDRLTRWLFVSVSVVGYAVLAVIDPPAPEAAADSGLQGLGPVRQFILMIVFAVGVVTYQRLLAHRAEEALEDANERSERLLLNILPEVIADRLRDGETRIADRVDTVTVMFIDLVGSTRMSEALPAPALVDVLNDVFSRLDALADEYGLEKIKTIGDSYMVVGGLPNPRPDHAVAVAEMALSALQEFEAYIVPGFGVLEMRIGVDTGPVVAGVIGKRKFGYDLWGRTVNTASRMQTTGGSGEIQVTDSVFRALGDAYLFEGPRRMSVKGIEGELSTYLLRGRAG